MHSRLKACAPIPISAMLIGIALMASACAKPQEHAHPTIDRFVFGDTPRAAFDCADCPPVVVDMCIMQTNADALVFVEVQASAYVVEECEKQRYSNHHYEQTLAILGVAAGAVSGDTIDVVAVQPQRVATDVGEFAIVGLRKLDGIWFTIGRVPIELIGPDTVPADHQVSSVTRIVYDLPTNFADFSQQAQAQWSDYQAACGRPQPDGERTDDELRTIMFDRECPDDPLPDVSNEGDYEDPESDLAAP